MTVPRNLKVFSLVTLRIFDKLYEAFPVPIEIVPRAVSNEIIADSFDETFDLISIADDTLRWLEAEGFLRHTSSSFECGIFYQVQLTLKGLTVLNSIPVSLDKKDVPESLMMKIKKVLSAGTGKTSDDSIRLVLNQVLKVASHIDT